MSSNEEQIKVYAFVGASGTGKSYRAQMVAGEYKIKYIIDDGLLVSGNNVVAGASAKKAPTKIETVKRALFWEESQRNEMISAIKKYKPKSILILGTSDGMVAKIASNLELPLISKIIHIEEVATLSEIETAQMIRKTQGKHVIPVPSFEIKKDFAGYILDPLQIFKSKGRGKNPYISEKSIVRPTFSYLGKFTISDNVFRQILEHLVKNSPDIHRVIKMRAENQDAGPYIYMEVEVVYGCNVVDAIKKYKEMVIKEINRLTTMQVQKITVIAKGIYMPEK